MIFPACLSKVVQFAAVVFTTTKRRKCLTSDVTSRSWQ